MTIFESRRSFLKSLALFFGCSSVFSEVSAAVETKTGGSKYKIGPWTGDDFILGHRLSAGDVPLFPDKPDNKVDFVIVGGGLAGLTAAYYLRDQNFLLLEQYKSTGGHCQGSSYNGIAYSTGAAYVGAVDGIFGDLFSALSLEHVTFQPEQTGFYFNNAWSLGVEGDTKLPMHKEFDKFFGDSASIFEALPADADPMKFASADLQKLDAKPFAPCLSGYSRAFIALMDRVCLSALGGGLDQISALAGYTLLEELQEPTYVFKGGNAAITRALAGKIDRAGSNRCLTGAFVWKIEAKEGGASVVYSLPDSSTHRIECKHVIVATPPLVASRQLANIADQLNTQLLSFKYCSYLIANLLMKKKLFNGTYDSYLGPPFSFSDIVVAERPYMASNSYKPEMGSVLTLYQPYPCGPAGRAALLAGDRNAISIDLAKQVEKLIPDFLKGIDEFAFSRWGHALAIAEPLYYSRLAKIRALQTDCPYTLAHSSITSGPTAESAIWGGKNAAERAMRLAVR